MRDVKRLTVVFVITAFMAVWSVAWAGGGCGLSPDQALQKLMDGNKRYVEGQMVGSKGADAAARATVAKGQKPYATVLTCSDSRVPPELVFDEGLGQIFVVRLAGNIADKPALGSIEYAAEHLGSPLVVVLGHTRCGAVTATVDSKGKAEGNIGSIVKMIAPAAQKAMKDCKGKDKGTVVEAAADNNVRNVAASVTKNSPIMSHLVKEGKVKVVMAKYDLDDGKVNIMEK